jgi:hypothetical protein
MRIEHLKDLKKKKKKEGDTFNDTDTQKSPLLFQKNFFSIQFVFESLSDSFCVWKKIGCLVLSFCIE